MTYVKIKGFQIFRDRHGRWRCYHRKTHIAIDLQQAPLGSDEFMAECARIKALAGAGGDVKPGQASVEPAKSKACRGKSVKPQRFDQILRRYLSNPGVSIALAERASPAWAI
jgi:hypothetical protein